MSRRASVPDVIGPGLLVLFCGINPGRWSGAVGHHFAHPGNRFWKVLHGSGFTEELLRPAEERRLLESGVGITNLVARVTTSAAELSREELVRGARTLERKIHRFEPRSVAFLGIVAYRTAFGRPRAVAGCQPEGLAGAEIWVLPNPSGLQAQYQLGAQVEQFAAMRAAVSRGPAPP